MTRPRDPDPGSDDPSGRRHDGPVLGETTAPADDPDSGGAGPASGAAGPSWPPAETKPDAH